MSNDSIFKTLAVATGLCVVCAIIVSVAAVFLKEKQDANKLFDKQVNILKAAGLVEATSKPDAKTVAELFQKVETVVVDLTTGEVVADADPAKAEVAPFVPVDKSVDVADIKKRQEQVIVYRVNDEEGGLETLVLPIFGKGLWSTMYGFLSLKSDLQTVAHITFYDQGETAGLGGEIANPRWTAKWEDKQAIDNEGKPVILVAKGNVDQASPTVNQQVDGISGATLTGKGVTNTVTYWLGENGFGPYLKNLKAAN